MLYQAYQFYSDVITPAQISGARAKTIGVIERAGGRPMREEFWLRPASSFRARGCRIRARPTAWNRFASATAMPP